ncbi:hypothetical protein KKE48_04730 [Patescibacteria group bacterium]|nr:hypothetical protein [Patescibacteria group bacterium]
MASTLPKYLHQYFWGDRLSELNLNDHRRYITQTILEKGDRQAASWLIKTTGKKNLKKSLSSLSLTPKSANFWQLYLS